MLKDAPLAVEVPASDWDKPGWIKVGVIAAVGFVAGIAWPRVLGVRLGPAAPGESAAAAAAASASQGGRAPDAPPASVVAKSSAVAAVASSAAPPTSASPGLPPNITVQKGTVLSCKTADGETKKGKECGPVPGVDLLVSPRIRKIATCSGIEGQTGKLSLVVNADFNSGRFTYDIGKTTSLPNVEAVTSCLKTSFHGISTASTSHEHQRYTVAYNATFAPASSDADDKVARKDRSSRADEPPEPKSEKAKEAKDEKDDRVEKTESVASGEALVAWEVALVRDAPKTGGLVARLPRGTKVKVGSSKDGWYPIKFGDGFANEGWVYRGAIGR